MYKSYEFELKNNAYTNKIANDIINQIEDYIKFVLKDILYTTSVGVGNDYHSNDISVPFDIHINVFDGELTEEQITIIKKIIKEIEDRYEDQRYVRHIIRFNETQFEQVKEIAKNIKYKFFDNKKYVIFQRLKDNEYRTELFNLILVSKSHEHY